jgi:hypothetical protein
MLMRAIRSLKIAQILVVCAMLCPYSFAKEKQLYEGPARPSSELVTIRLPYLGFPTGLRISIQGKWFDLHDGSQVLPGSYDVFVLSMCQRPSNRDPAHPPVPWEFFEYPDSFTAAAGDTVFYTSLGVNYPVPEWSTRKVKHIPNKQGTTCYRVFGAFHTIMKDNVPYPDDVHIKQTYSDKLLDPVADLVLAYLDAAARQDTSAAKVFLSTDSKGDLTGYFKNFSAGLRYSATNTRVISGEVNAEGHNASLVVGVVLTSSPSIFSLSGYSFDLVQENGVWKISKIAPW